MFRTPPTPEPAHPANLAPEQLDSNQLARTLPWHFGRRWLALFWCVSKVYNYRAVKTSSGSGGKGGGKGGSANSTTNVTCDVAGLVACCTEDLIEAIEVNNEIVWAAAGGISRDGAHSEHSGDIVVPDVGTFRFHWGTETAAGDWLVLGSSDEVHPYYRRQPVLEAKGLNCGSAGTVPNIRVLVERAPRFGGLLDEERSREGANPITGLAELIEDDFAGCGLQGIVDVDTAALVADALRARTKTVAVPGNPTHVAYMGYFSGYLIERQSLGSIIAATLECFDGWARRKGEKLELGFFSHGPIDTSGLLELTLHDFVSEPEFPNPAPDSPEVFTDAIVTGPDRDRNMEDSWQSAGNDVARDRLQETRTKTYARPFLCTSYQQKEQAQELSNFYAIAAKETPAKFRREKVGTLQPGDRFILNYSSSSVRQVYRVTRRHDPANGGIVELGIIIERGLAPLTFIAPADPAPTLPEPPVAAAIVNARMVQLPAVFAGGPAPVVVPLAERPVAAAAGFRVHFSADDVTYDAQGDTIDWALRATLVGSIAPGTGSFTIAAAGLDLGLLQPQSAAAQDDDTLLLFVGGEIMSLGASSALGSGQYSVAALRGRRGSAAASHASAAVCYIIPRAELLQLDHASFPRTAATRYFKLQTLVLRGEQELATALKLTFTFADTSVNVPTSFAASGAASAVNLAWTNPSDPDLSHVEIFARTTGAGAPGVSDIPDSTEPVVPGGRTLCSRPLAAGAAKDYYIRAVDTASYKSAFVGPQSATALTTTGNFIDYVFKRAASQPATPTGNGTPSGWSDGPPAGTDPLWMSSAEKTYADVLVGTWSTPIRLDGSLTAQYSVTGTGSWHSTFTTGDLFMRVSTDGGNTWSSEMRIIGEQGAAGTAGTRGSKWFYRALTGTASWSDSEADAAITAASLTKVLLDTVTLYKTSANYSETKYWDGSAWQTVAQIIDGNLIVHGTIGTNHLVASIGITTPVITGGSITGTSLDIGSGDNRFQKPVSGALTFGDTSNGHTSINSPGSGLSQVSLKYGATVLGQLGVVNAGGSDFVGRLQVFSKTGATDFIIAGSPTAANAPFLTWASDTNLYRKAANILKTDDDFEAGGDLVLPSTQKLRLDRAGSLAAYLDEDWGICLRGDSTHPVHVRGGALVLGATAGGSYTAGRLYDGNGDQILRERYTGSVTDEASIIACLQHHGLCS